MKWLYKNPDILQNMLINKIIIDTERYGIRRIEIDLLATIWLNKGTTKEEKTKIASKIKEKYYKAINEPIEVQEKDKIKTVFITKQIEYIENKHKIVIYPSKGLKDLINQQLEIYTISEILDQIKIKDDKTRNLYKLIKQNKTKGYIELNLSELKELLEIKDNKTNKNLINRELPKVVQELIDGEYIKNLNYEIIRNTSKKGKPIEEIKIIFDREKPNKRKTIDL